MKAMDLSKPPSDPGPLKRLVEAGCELTGTLAGTSIGFLMGGPPGAFAGAFAATGLKQLTMLAADIVQRGISERETKRIGATLAIAAKRIEERLASGEQQRDDGFFDEQPPNRSAAQEIAEGVVLAAQREHEEKKLRFYGNLIASLAFRPDIDRAHANLLVRRAEELSYRQLCLIVLFLLRGNVSLRTSDYREADRQPGKAVMPVLHEIFDLYHMGVLSSGEAMFGISDVNPSKVLPQPLAGQLYELMELRFINVDDLNAIVPLLQQ